MFSQPASPPRVPPAAKSLRAAPDQGRATQHGVSFRARRAFSFNQFGRSELTPPLAQGMIAIRKDAIESGQSSFKAKGAASGQDATPFRSAAGQSAAQPRNNSFCNFTNRLGIRPPCSSLPGREASAALGTSPFPFQPTPFIQINHSTHFVSASFQFVAELETTAGKIACVKNAFAMVQE